MRRWTTLLVVAAIAAIALTIAAVAYAGNVDGKPAPGRGTACGVLAVDPEARAAIQDLRAEHRRDMREWWRRYGADPTAGGARQALRDLRQEHAAEMRAILEKFGVEAGDPAGRGACGGAGAGAGGCGPAGESGGCGGGCGAGAFGGGGGCGGMMGAGWSY